MKGKIIDWSKVKGHRTPAGVFVLEPESRRKVVGALQHFMAQPDRKDGPIRKALEHFATKGDFPTEILQILEKYHAETNYDLGYEQVFDVRDFTGTTASGFRIENVSDGLTFAKVAVGDKAKVFKFSGTETTVNFDLYGGGLQWHRTLLDDQQYWTLEDNAISFRNKYYSARAAVFYALLEAVGSGGNAQSWAAVTPGSVATSDKDYNAIRDANTINAAVLAIMADLKDDGVGITPQSEFVIIAPLDLKARLSAALGLLQQPFAGSVNRQAFNCRPVYTLMLTSASYYYVVFPKAKMKGGYRMDLTIYDQFDITAYSDLMVGWGRYGGAIGDTEQVARCAIA